MLQPLDGPAIQGILTSVTDSTPVIAKVGGSAFSERKVLTLQSHKEDAPSFGKFYVYFADDSETPNDTAVSTKGFIQDVNSLHSYEASDKQVVWLMSVSGTIDIRIAERS